MFGICDGVIDALDTDFAGLRVWQDGNENAITDAGELKTLAELDIASINLTPDVITPVTQAGNVITATGTYTRTDTTTGITGDVILNNNTYQSEWLESITLTAGALAQPDLKGHGTIADLREAMSYDASLIADVISVLPTLNTEDLSVLRANDNVVQFGAVKPRALRLCLAA